MTNLGFLKLTLISLTWVWILGTSQALSAPVRIGLVLDKGGKDDKSFNAAAYLGATQAKNELGVLIKVVEATDDHAFEPMLRAFAQKDFDLIIGVGFAQADAIKKVSSQFPQKRFVIVDSEVKAANVSSLMFEEHEASYLVGAIAAWTTKTGKIGFIGGMDIPLIRRFEMGFKAGAKKANSEIKVASNFIGVTGDSWNNPTKAKELALSQYQSGADVVFAAAGASNVGLFDAAEEKKKFAIGVDSNQNWIKPGFVLTSMLKRVDQAVYTVCKEASQGKFEAGLHRFGLHNSGVDYSVDSYNEKILTPDIRQKAEKLKAEIISKKIQVPDYYLKKK